jgi:hypothetical protein
VSGTKRRDTAGWKVHCSCPTNRINVIVRQQHDGNAGRELPDLARKRDNAHVLDVDRGDDTVKMLSGVEKFESFLAARYVGDFGKRTKIKGLELMAEEFVQLPILFEEVAVIQARNQENVPHCEPYQPLKCLQTTTVKVFVADAIGREYGRRLHGHSIPPEWKSSGNALCF